MSQKSSIINHQSSICVYRPRLHVLSIALVVCTFVLVALGGNVTSRDAGLSVPDGFTVFGHFLWSFPVSQWVGNIFHEHIHRLMGSAVGLLTLAVCLWVMVVEKRRWMRWLAIGLFAGVVTQGILGGLRVSEISTTLAILHGITGQLVFTLTVVTAAALGRHWFNATTQDRPPQDNFAFNGKLSLALLAVIFVQLALGATVRHTHSALAIPDFPTAYGQVIPPFNPDVIRHKLDKVPYESFIAYYQPWQVALHFAHRVWALVVVGTAVWLVGRIGPSGASRKLTFPLAMLGLMLMAQVALGAMVIWTQCTPDIATAHQSLGAIILATATLIAIRSHLPPLPTPTAVDIDKATAKVQNSTSWKAVKA
ncbi:MAG: hypothetical protein GC164_08105 [Phycisphaera sp.]|nr:hypothetical protein [Phycisphaera sp.]